MKSNSCLRDGVHHKHVLVNQKAICSTRPSLYCLLLLLLRLQLLQKSMNKHIYHTKKLLQFTIY